MASPNPPTSNVSDAEIVAFLDANKGLSDSGIRQAMDRYGVNVGQMARATGMNYGDVSDRYNKAKSNLDADFLPVDPKPYVQEQEAYADSAKLDRPSEFKPYPPRKPLGEIGMPPAKDKPLGPGPIRSKSIFDDSYLIGPMPRGRFDDSDLESYLTMGKAAQMGYKKGGAVKAKSNSKSASGKSSGYSDKNGRINLGSSRVSTTVKSKKNPNF